MPHVTPLNYNYSVLVLTIFNFYLLFQEVVMKMYNYILLAAFDVVVAFKAVLYFSIGVEDKSLTW